MTSPTPTYTIALAGQPNVGKSTVFNMLTGLNQHVGNWPGKTVEQKQGNFIHDGQVIQLVDLPGTYSMTANSEEERIARDYLLREKPDVVIVIVNAATLERNLYLVAELLNMPTPLIVGVNMQDVAERAGIHVETHVLQAALGAPAISLVASKNQGIHELIDAALELIKNSEDYRPNRPEILPEHRPILEEIRSLLNDNTTIYPKDWVATKLLEGDAEITELIRQSSPEEWTLINPILLRHEDAYLDVAGGRYEWIMRMVRAAVVNPKPGAINLTDRLDAAATHPFWGLIILLSMFGLVFWLTYTAALPIVDWLESLMAQFADTVRQILSIGPDWFSSLIVDGLIGGVGAVLSLLPVLIIFFALLGILEDVGYLARLAYVMDRFMHSIGLHGRSFLPLFISFGCNIPGILGARIIEDRRARLFTILLAPLVPCTARLSVIAFLAPAFFGQYATLATWGLVVGNMLLLFLVGLLINKVVLKGNQLPFIMELPLYHLPNPRSIGIYVWQNTWGFVQKATQVILIASAVIWFFSYFPHGEIQSSWLANFGRLLEPAGSWLGLGDWRIIMALFSSFVAKENTIATLGILLGPGNGLGLAAQVALILTLPAALAFFIIQMTFIPCVATIGAIKSETNGWKYPLLSIGMLLIISILAAAFVYYSAVWMGLG
jgi:ferrous iron transport protein B